MVRNLQVLAQIYDDMIPCKFTVIVPNVIQASLSPPAFRALHPPPKARIQTLSQTILKASQLHCSIGTVGHTRDSWSRALGWQICKLSIVQGLIANRSRTWSLTAGCGTLQQLHDSLLLISDGGRLGSNMCQAHIKCRWRRSGPFGRQCLVTSASCWLALHNPSSVEFAEKTLREVQRAAGPVAT